MLCNVYEIFGVVKCKIYKFVRKKFKFMNLQFVNLQCLFVQFPSENQFKILTNKFQIFFETFHIIVKIDGSHISILAPIIGGEEYYYF
jgi:hypothetical protein